MYNIRNQGFTGTQKSVYRDSTGSKLEEASLFRTMLIPHYQRFDSDSQTSLSITVHNLSAFTLEQSIVASTMTFTHSTAVSTPFTCMVGVNGCESDILVEASGFHGSFEEQDRHPQNLFIESSALGTESFKVLNSNVSVILDGKVCDVSDDLTCPILDEVLLVSPELSERLDSFVASFVCEALEFFTPCHDSFTFNPYIFAEVELFENLAFGINNADSITLAVDIDSDYILSGWNLLFRTIQESDYLAIACQAISFASPAVIKQGFISLPVAVLSNGNTNRIARVEAQPYKITAEREGFTTSGNIEFDSDCFERGTLCLDNCSYNLTNHLAIEGGTQFGI
jgi:hypothetical protein